jgi:hypothetical protein
MKELVRVTPSNKTQKSLLTHSILKEKPKRHPVSILPQRGRLYLTKFPAILLFLEETRSHNVLIHGHPLLSLWIYPHLRTNQTTSSVQKQTLTFVRLIISYIIDLFHLHLLPVPSLPSVHEFIPPLSLPFHNLMYLV